MNMTGFTLLQSLSALGRDTFEVNSDRCVICLFLTRLSLWNFLLCGISRLPEGDQTDIVDLCNYCDRQTRRGRA